ncbi:hypothetical protein BJX70DRAFT_373820 [Aspergillus crustosus]
MRGSSLSNLRLLIVYLEYSICEAKAFVALTITRPRSYHARWISRINITLCTTKLK